jgi:hypothetical protein
MRLSVGSALSVVDINKVGGIPETSRAIYKVDELRNVYILGLHGLSSSLTSDKIDLGKLCIGDEKLHLLDLITYDVTFDQTAIVRTDVESVSGVIDIIISTAKTGYVTSGGRSVYVPPTLVDRIYDPIPNSIWIKVGYAWGWAFVRIISGRRNLSRFANVVTGGAWVVGNQLEQYDSYSDATATLVEKARIDFGAVKNIRKFANRVKYYISASATGNLVRCEVSADGTTWTTLWQDTAPPTSETEYYYVFNNLTNVRYVRWLVNSGATTSTIYLKNYPLFAWEG